MKFTLLVVALLLVPRSAAAYSVLAHEAMIDAAWEQEIAPLLARRFPRSTAADVRAARAYAYGGSLIQDLGYYPFGSKFFSNIVHYVRSGDFVEALVREARDVNEYAFALGALAHYTSDTLGHPLATNRAVPIIYPKLRAEHGPVVLYADSPARHVMVEFAFDVQQAARGTFKSDAYQSLIGFEVATPVLERAFRATYGLELKDVFGDIDLAIGSYRWAVSKLIPDITREAFKDDQEKVFTFTRAQYEEAFGTTYRKPGLFARIVVAIFKVMPKFGPFKPLAYEPLTPETERLFVDSFRQSVARYRDSLGALRAGRLALADADLDTGKPPAPGANPLADETRAELTKKFTRDPARP